MLDARTAFLLNVAVEVRGNPCALRCPWAFETRAKSIGVIAHTYTSQAIKW